MRKRKITQFEIDRYARVKAAVDRDMSEGRSFWASFYSVSGLTFTDDIVRFAEVARAEGDEVMHRRLTLTSAGDQQVGLFA